MNCLNPRSATQNTVGFSTLWVGQPQIFPCLTTEITHQSLIAKNKPWHHTSAIKAYIGGLPPPPTSARARLLQPWDLCQKNAIMLYWSSWRRLNKSLGCDGAAVLGAREAVLPSTPPISHPIPSISDFPQSPGSLGIFGRCWQSNRITSCTPQTCVSYKKQQAPLNS